jgi:putative hemolysin
MPVVFGQIAAIVLMIIANGVFAMSEIAIISARRARLQQKAGEGDHRARTALGLAEAPNRLLSTVQIGITLIGILTGALGGATLARELGLYLSRLPLLKPYGEALGLAIVVAATTYLSLVIGELVPKRLALSSPERIALAVARPMRALSIIAAPAVRLLSLSTELVLRVLGLHLSEEAPVTEEEIKVLLQQGTEAGVFQEAEQDMVESVLLLDERRAAGLMTPRPEIAWLDVGDPPEEIRRKVIASPYSRFPVCEGSLDNVLGEVEARDLLARSLCGESWDLRALLRRPLYVPETMPALKVLEAFKQSGTQVALVVDEYGSIQGLVTLKDILEAIVGDVPSVEDLAEPQAVRREDGSWLLDGMLSVADFRELLEVGALPAEEQGLYQTVAGFVMIRIGRIPSAADHFEWGGLRFEVMDMDGIRIDKVLVTPTRQVIP